MDREQIKREILLKISCFSDKFAADLIMNAIDDVLKERDEWIRRLEKNIVDRNIDNLMWIAADSPLKEDYQTLKVTGHPSGITGVVGRRRRDSLLRLKSIVSLHIKMFTDSKQLEEISNQIEFSKETLEKQTNRFEVDEGEVETTEVVDLRVLTDEGLEDIRMPGKVAEEDKGEEGG